jgi:serine/threonine protein kinase/tetratricopeptide (TPR) repeat protein
MMTTVFKCLGPYEIHEEIGRGGMAVVFLASDTRTNRRVALKLVPTGSDREAREILDAERFGAKLQEQFCRASRHVPTVYEYGTDGPYFYIAMEYLEGQNLSELITHGPLAPERAVGIAIELCHFLEAAHGFEATIDDRKLHSILHGDLKPRNIRVLEHDQVMILDFGIAKALSLSRKVTRNDFGSIAYLSPERLDSGEIDAHADFWALGVLLYEMVSGGQPFQAPDTRRLEQRIKSSRPPASLDGRCSPGLQAVIARLLAPNRENRYSSGKAIREDLECVKAGQQTQAERDGWPVSARDEPETRRTRPLEELDEEPTRRTSHSWGPPLGGPTRPSTGSGRPELVEGGLKPDPTEGPPSRLGSASARRAVAQSAEAAGGAIPSRLKPDPTGFELAAGRRLRAALLLLAVAIIGNELWVSFRAERLAAAVSTQNLSELGETWRQYDALRERSLEIGLMGLENVLTEQSAALAEGVVANYRTPLPTVRENQWLMARDVLARALSARRDDARLRGALRYCEGHLHRINGEARKAENETARAQQEFTEAVIAFREAAELRPNWPDPFLGLTRTFIYGLEDVDRGADALREAERFGYTSGDRETAQLGDGYRTRAETFVRMARRLSGMPQEQEYLARAAEAYRQAVSFYSKAITFADVARNLRTAQRGLNQVEQRLADLSGPSVESSAPLQQSFRLTPPAGPIPMASHGSLQWA